MGATRADLKQTDFTPVAQQDAEKGGCRSWRPRVKAKNRRSSCDVSIQPWTYLLTRAVRQAWRLCSSGNVMSYGHETKARWESVSELITIQKPWCLFLPVQRWIFSFIFGTKDKYLISLKKKKKPTVWGHSVVTSFKVLASSNNS